MTKGGTSEKTFIKRVIALRGLLLIVACLVLVFILFFSTCSFSALFGRITFFPVSKSSPVTYPLERARGQLYVNNGSLRLATFQPLFHDYLLLWPQGYSWQRHGVITEVLNEKGETVARIGEILTIDGGEMPEGNVEVWYSPALPEPNLGPFWIVGEIK